MQFSVRSLVLSLGAIVGCVLSAVGANAQMIFGLNDGQVKVHDVYGGIYEINAATGAASFYLSTPALNNTGQGNGLAYDLAGTFYYVDAANFLYRRNNAGETNLGKLSHTANDASFRNGKYIYVSGGKLYTAAISGNTFTETSTTIPFGFGTGLDGAGYGDIAFDLTGDNLYGASDKGLYRYNLSSNAVTVLNASSGNLQLGFSGSQLYGIATDTDKVYNINTTSGALTLASTLTPSAIRITDAASAVPEPGAIALVAGLAIPGAAFLRRRKGK